MNGQVKHFDTTKNGDEVLSYTLQSRDGASVKILNYGGIIQSLWVPDKNGVMRDVVLGYDRIAGYEENPGYLGAMIGRFANRIRAGKFTLNGKEYRLAVNDKENHLHGGTVGFNARIWQTDDFSEQSLTLSLVSPDGEEGYPGNLKVTVRYDWSDDHALTLTYHAETDADTIVNLTNHSYFNLNGQENGSALGHMVQICSDRYTENDSTGCPNGTISPVEGTPLDLREWRQVGERIDEDFPQLTMPGGYDHNRVLDGTRLVTAARLYAPESGILMVTETDQPGMQFYSGNYVPHVVGKAGAVYDKRHGLCFETQGYPNAMEHPHFPSPVVSLEKPYHHVTIYRFSVSGQLPD